MPTYVYECPNCNYTFEKFKKITQNNDEVCPRCNNFTKRIISGGTGVIFKGSGFYCNDYSKIGRMKKEEENKEKSELK